MASKQCGKCKSCFPERVWKAHKSRYGSSYYCPSCGIKAHWRDLEKPQKNIN